ncbi:MAG: 3-methylcrotonyl-CoA carboxylase, partial [Pseudomonadota bacterium]|nr:3-methylcrotonyl-CoA carboxylase [Pseudomonadota bacterium]
IADGWRLGHGSQRHQAFMHRGERIEVHAQGSGGDYRIEHAGEVYPVSGARIDAGVLSLRIADRARRFLVLDDGASGHLLVHDGERRLRLQPVEMYRHEGGAAAGGADQLVAPMPGRVVATRTSVGDQVESGQELVVIEAMKMELSLKSPREGVVTEVRAIVGDFVEADMILVVLAS